MTLEKLNTLLTPFQLKGKIAIAVSGGADSLALAFMMKKWADSYNQSIQLITITIDHKLRPESTSEAEKVSSWMKNQSLEHHILTWEHSLLTSRLQQTARQARYQLLKEWCIAHTVETLMTAHHLYDQWETFMMRLSKGSGLTGLCSIRSCIKTDYGQLIRPFLTTSPTVFKNFLKEINHPFIQDPSNENIRHERIKWRQFFSVLSDKGLSPDMIQKTIYRLQRTDLYCNQQTDKAFLDCYDIHHGLKINKFRMIPQEIGQRILNKIISYPHQSHPLSYQSLSLLYQKIIAPNFKGATLGGYYFKRKAKGWIEFVKEKRTSIHKK